MVCPSVSGILAVRRRLLSAALWPLIVEGLKMLVLWLLAAADGEY